jgi:hypothetical protein
VSSVDVDRVREARRQKLRKEFDNLTFKPEEGVEDFALRMSAIVSELQSLGDTTSELDGVQKMLWVAPARYGQMACSIETLLDLRELSIEELSGRLAASEGRGEPEQDASGRLLLTEEEWRARSSGHGFGEGSSGEGEKGRFDSKPKEVNNDRAQAKGGGDAPPRRKGECRYCGIKGHWAKECRKRERDRWEKGHEAHIAQAEEAPPAMLLTASVTDVVTERALDAGIQYVFLNEERVVPMPTDGRRWFFDSGASNHMTGCREMIADG